MSIFLLYLFTRLEVFIAIAKAWALISVILITVCGFYGFVENECNGDNSISKSSFKWCKRFFVSMICATFIYAIVPSQKDAAIILAGYGVIEAAQTDTAKCIASKSVELIENTLDNYLKNSNVEKK